MSSAASAGFGFFSLIYDFGPDGTVFEPPAVLTFYYGEPAEGIDETTLNIYKYNENIGWQLLPKLSQNTDENWIKTEVESLSLFAVMRDIQPPKIVINSPVGCARYVFTLSSVTIDYSVMDNADPAPQRISYLTHLSNGATIPVNNGDIIDPITLTSGYWCLTVEAWDYHGNRVSSTTASFEIIHDIKPPRTALLELYGRKWESTEGKIYITSGTEVALAAIDDLVEVGDGVGSGVKHTKYRLDLDGIERIYESPFKFAPMEDFSDGEHSITYYSEDLAGNREGNKSITIFLDNTPPVLSVEITDPKHNDGRKEYINEISSLILSATDYGCGVSYIKYRLVSGGDCENAEWRLYDSPVILSAEFSEGEYRFECIAVDNLGNTTFPMVETIYLDKTPPVSAITIGAPNMLTMEKTG